MDEVFEDAPPPPPPPAAKPPAAKRPRGGRGGGRAGGRVGNESRSSRSLSQRTPAAKAMVEEEEDDFVMERPQRTSASQVWRIRLLFQQFLDNLALVRLFCGDFRSCLDIFSHFLWRFSVFFCLEIFSRFFGDFQ